MLVPLEILDKEIGREILVMTQKQQYKGILSAFDKNVNIFLENAIEKEEETKELGSVFLNGENVCMLVFSE